MSPSSRRPPTQVVTGVELAPISAARVARTFRALVDDGAELRPAGAARHDPSVLLTPRYMPRAMVSLFDATYFLADFRFDDALGFFVAYVVLEGSSRGRTRIHPRIFYKDSSLVWRVASHFLHDEDEYWIGKGDVREDGELVTTVEDTTNLPFEIQDALDVASRQRRRRRDDDAIELILRQGPSGRVEPYADFTAPRRAAAARSSIHGGRPIARFTRRGDPTSLTFVRGYEPDFEHGVLEQYASESKFFGGTLRKFRVLSTNRQVQHFFFASPTHAWPSHPQTLTTELSTYGVRTLDVIAPDDLSIPGYEYHEAGASQIPEGFVGAPHPLDPHRADASAWLEQLPVVQEFRTAVLAARGERRRRT